jgi:hypothetical protein
MFVLMAWLVAAVILFLLRPQNMRQSGNEKPSNQVDLSLIYISTLFLAFQLMVCNIQFALSLF